MVSEQLALGRDRTPTIVSQPLLKAYDVTFTGRERERQRGRERERGERDSSILAASGTVTLKLGMGCWPVVAQFGRGVCLMRR